MKIKSKFVLFFCAFALIFSVLSVSCFAYVNSINVGGVYTFIPLVSTQNPSNDEFYTFDVSGSISILIDGVVYNGFSVEEGDVLLGSDSGNLVYHYGYWTLSEGGVDYPVASVTFTVLEIDDSIPFEFLHWLEGNVVSDSSDSFYSNLYSSISDGVFGAGAILSPEQVMTLTLISTILSYAFILLPLLLVIGFVLRCFRL